MTDFNLAARIAKLDPEQRIVWGWASVVSENGKPVVDRQGDVIEIDELQRAAHDFIAFYRTGGAMHAKLGIGVVVDSIVFTDAVQQALGIELGREGWFVGMKVVDDATWEAVKAGEYEGFSIGGTGLREDE